MTDKYPMTRSQMQAAQRRGWIKTGDGWKRPKNFTATDQVRIALAQVRRQRRKVGAD